MMRSAAYPVTLRQQWIQLSPAIRLATTVYVIARLATSLIAIVALNLFPLPPHAPQAVVHNQAEAWLLAPWYRWDAEWFLKIAREGYGVDDGRSGNYPLYPALARLVGDIFGGNYLLSGLIVSNLALWLALILLFEYVRPRYGYRIARAAVLALALYPSFFFNLAYYAESLLLLFTIATFYAMERGRWGWTALFASLAVLSKLPAVVLLAPIAWEFWQQRRRLLSFDSIALLSIPLTILAWTLIRRWLGPEATSFDFSSPLSILSPILTPSYQKTYEAAVVWPWEGLWLGIMALPTLWPRVMFLKVAYDFLILVFCTLMLPFVWRLKRPSYTVYFVALYLMNLTLILPYFPLANFPRRMMMALPMFIALALLSRYRWVKLPLVFSGLSLSLILTAFFVWWVWVG